MSNAFIYTGEKGVGKSTYLQEIFLKKPNICGILQPRINGIKCLVDVVTGEHRRLELDNAKRDEKVVTIGNYIFSEETFLWGQQKLIDAIQTSSELIIIDEIGPLELHGFGLEPVLAEIISNAIVLEKELLLVVRPTLIEKIIIQYNLSVPIVFKYGQEFPIELIAG